MSRRVSSTSCRTSATRSYRWIAVLTVFAMLGVAGFVVAYASTQGTKVAPLSQDAKEKKARATAMTAEAGPGAASNSSTHSGISPLAPPANDDCSAAVVVPGVPYTSPVVDITDATPQESNDGFHTCAAAGADRTVWYQFTPAATGAYVITTCPARGATGSTVYDTLISIFDGTSGCPAPGPALACDDSTSCASALPGAPYVDQATIAPVLIAGTTYYISAGHWTDDAGGVTPGYENVSVHIELSPAPSNDTCGAGGSNATPLFLNRVVKGTTASAANDYRSDGTAACFSGVGQTPTTSAGLDVVFKFDPPADGKYSFRYVQDDSAAALRGQNPVLYLSHSCPASAPGGPAVSCNPAIGDKGANRITCTPPCSPNTATNGNRSEEIDCVQLNVADGTAYLFFDDRASGNAGGPLAVEVTECHPEAEGNDDTASANPFPACFTTGAMDTAADVDFFSLGTPPAGSKIFAAIDGVAANGLDFELRITNTTDTLGYDDNDGTSQVGLNSPNIGGVIADGNPLYARVNKGSLASELIPSAPYHLYARVESGVAQEEVDTPSNASYYFGNVITGGGFVKGVHTTATDQDCFRFVAREGDNIAMFSDNNPDRVGGPVVNTWPILRDVVGGPPTATRFTGQVLRNIVTPSPGTLTGVTPSVVSEFWDYRARYTGTYMVCYFPDAPADGYPLPYQGSISLNCGPIPDPAASSTDISVTKTGPAGPVNTGDFIEYTITLTNNSATDIAVDAKLVDTLPAELKFLGLLVNDGFGGNNVGCISLPTPGTTDADIDCTVFSIAPGASVEYTVQAQVANCIGAGVDVTNSVGISSLTSDPNSANNAASWTFATSESGSCNDLLCDDNGCIANACTENDHCEAGVCTSSPVDCNDQSECTDDSCNPSDQDGDPCINDSTQRGDLCFDGIDCTYDACDPVLFCVFPPTPAGSSCDDFLACTNNDACDGNGTCVGHSVCDDGQPCTDDFADENNACACDNPLSFPGTVCDDGNACTNGTVCDGNSGDVSSCNGGTPTNCDDGNPCTDDSCDASTGCVHTNNTASCNDGNACTDGDTCGGGTCNGGSPHVCNDGNGCTDDSCDSGTGCVYTNNTASCDDGNACTSFDTCSGGSCSGTAFSCDNGNACDGVETCNPATGCVSGTPVVCTASDQCHSAGTCNPGSGLCSNPALPDGTTCDDGNAGTSGDSCQGGICTGGTTCTPTNDPKTWGWWHSQCTSGGHSGESIDNADAACVAATNPAFSGVTTAAQVCDILNPSHGNGPSGRAQRQAMALALNICSQRICPNQGLDATCTTATSVGQARTQANAVLVNPGSTNTQFAQVECQATEINNGKALEFDTLKMKREGTGMRLNWQAPLLNDGTGTPSSYKIWRRPMGSMAAFTQIGTTTGLTFIDNNSGTTMWQYEVTSVN
jgi:uncharacterized repeat protein (TIGR01451 family)